MSSFVLKDLTLCRKSKNHRDIKLCEHRKIFNLRSKERKTRSLYKPDDYINGVNPFKPGSHPYKSSDHFRKYLDIYDL